MGRIAACMVEAPCARRFLAISAYLVASAGLSRENLEILGVLGKTIQDEKELYMIGADFNNSPVALSSCGFLDKFWLLGRGKVGERNLFLKRQVGHA